MSYIHPAALEGLRKRWERPDAYRFAAPGTPEAIPPWERPETKARWAAERDALERAAFERELFDLRRDWEELKREIAAKREAERRKAEELRRKSDLAFEIFRRAFKSYAQQQKYSPDQPRVPAGNPDGGQWTGGGGSGAGRDPGRTSGRIPSTDVSAARRRGVRPEPTLSQQIRLDAAIRRQSEAVSRVQQLQPDWQPTPSLTSRDNPTNLEGMIRAKEAEAREAEARFIALSRAGEDAPYATRSAQTSAEVLRPGGRFIGARDPEVSAPNVRILSPEEFEAARIALMANARRIEPDAGYNGVWYQRDDGTRFGLRLSADHGLTLEVVHGGYYLPNGLRFHQR